MRQLACRLLRWTRVGYPLTVVTWEVARRTPLSGWWPFELIDIFALLFLLPLPLLALPMAGSRQLWVKACLLAPLLAVALDYGPIVEFRQVPEPEVSVRILTANLLVDSGEATLLEQVVEAEQPDIVAVQELGPEMATRVARTLSRRYPYQALYPYGGPLGIGILSRFPMYASRPQVNGPGTCYCQESVLDIDGHRVTLTNMHPYAPSIDYRSLGPIPVPTRFDTQLQRQAVQAVLRRIETLSGPILLVGDLNTSDRQPAYASLSEHLRDTYRERGRGLGYTFPVGWSFPLGAEHTFPLPPILRIDYVWHNDAWAGRAAWVGSLVGSDHRYVVADLVLP